MKLATCPYCGNKIPYFRLFVIKSKCDYVCSKCKRESKISISSKMKTPFYVALLISALIILVNMIFKSTDKLWLVALCLLPMVIFYLMIPFYIKLKPYIKYRDVVCERLKSMEDAAKAERAARRAKNSRPAKPADTARPAQTMKAKNTKTNSPTRRQSGQTNTVKTANRKGTR